MSWDAQPDGTYLGVATPRAIEWAGDDRAKLAAIGFVAWCRDHQLDPQWFVDTFHQVTCGIYLIAALLDRSTNHDRYEVQEREDSPWFGVVRVMSGTPPVIHILGVSHSAPSSGPRTALVSPREWLRAFPIHHVTPPEAIDASRDSSREHRERRRSSDDSRPVAA